MKYFSKSLVILTGLTLFVNCTSSKKIQKSMNSKSYSMAYLMDSKISDTKKNTTVTIDTIFFDSNILSDTTKVKREKSWFLPLVFVYIWNSQSKCVQGKSMIEEDIPVFLKKSMINEINRSGNFKMDTLNHADYKIELSIDNIKTEGPYASSGFLYFALYVYGSSHTDRAGPATSNLTVSYKLKKDEQIIHSNSFNSEKITEQIKKRYTHTNNLQQDYAISMVEATSYNFKNVIELIVNDINSYFGNREGLEMPGATESIKKTLEQLPM